jgi:CRP-like cAMP-binding protein
MNPASLHTSAGDLLIRKLERYAPLPEESRQAIRALPWRTQEYSRGAVIVHQGEVCEESTMVVTGVTLRYKALPDGLRQIVGMQVPGDFADLHSFVLKPIDHAIAAAAPSRVAKVAHTAVAHLLKNQPDLVRWLMWDMALDAAIAREWLAALGRRTAYQQLGHLFCELYLRLSWAGQVRDHAFDLALNQAELGDACGLSTVHVNRSLQALRRDRLIVLENHHLTIPDLGALSAAAAFDPSYLHGLSVRADA